MHETVPEKEASSFLTSFQTFLFTKFDTIQNRLDQMNNKIAHLESQGHQNSKFVNNLNNDCNSTKDQLQKLILEINQKALTRRQNQKQIPQLNTEQKHSTNPQTIHQQSQQLVSNKLIQNTSPNTDILINSQQTIVPSANKIPIIKQLQPSNQYQVQYQSKQIYDKQILIQSKHNYTLSKQVNFTQLLKQVQSKIWDKTITYLENKFDDFAQKYFDYESFMLNQVQVVPISNEFHQNATQNQTKNIIINETQPYRNQQNHNNIDNHLANQTANMIAEKIIQKPNSQSINKKFYQMQRSFTNLQSNVSRQLQKVKQPVQGFKTEVQKLRGELQQFKLKKQAKYLKLLSSNSGNQINKNTTNQNSNDSLHNYMQYLAQKVHTLTKEGKQFLPRLIYDRKIQQIEESLLYIRKSVANKVGHEQLSKVQKIEDLKTLKRSQIKVKDNPQPSDSKLNIPLATSSFPNQNDYASDNYPLAQVRAEHKHANSEIISQSKAHNSQNPQQLTSIKQQNESILSINNEILIKYQTRLDTQQQFMKQMNKFYNQKLNKVEIQLDHIRQISENHGKYQSHTLLNSISHHELGINNKDKIYAENMPLSNQRLFNQLTDESMKNYPQKTNIMENLDLLSQPKIVTSLDYPSNKVITNSNSKSVLDNLKSQQIYNFQISSVKKKINKVNGKCQAIQKTLKEFKFQFSKQVEVIHNSSQTKTDWQSFRKAVKYFDQKIKLLQDTLKVIIQNLQQAGTIGNGQKKSVQVAAKKQWSCLFCDKEIKNYQGKVSDTKYLGVYQSSARFTSPRAGGYFKQAAKQKEYDKLYLQQKGSFLPSFKSSKDRKKSFLSKIEQPNSLGKSVQFLKRMNQEQDFKKINLP